MSKHISECWVDEGNDEGYWVFPHPDHYVHTRQAFEGHYPAKHEAKLLRRIMSQTGLTEAEVRDRKKYRKMLSDTQKPKGTTYGVRRGCDKFFKGIVKEATKATKLATKHPITLAKIDKLLKGDVRTPIWFYGSHANCDYCNHLLAELKK